MAFLELTNYAKTVLLCTNNIHSIEPSGSGTTISFVGNNAVYVDESYDTVFEMLSYVAQIESTESAAISRAERKEAEMKKIYENISA